MWWTGEPALAAAMSRRNPGGFRRRPRIADTMTPALLACVDRSLAAERAGDVGAALEWHQAVPQFRKGRHRSLLDRFAQLGDELPEWVWARWIVYQTTRCEDGETGALVRGRRQDITETWHADLLDRCFDAEGDPIKVLARVQGESWIDHQLAPYDDGALVSFVDEFATGRLAEHAGLAVTWAGVRLSGYRLGESLPGARLQVREANGTGWTEVLDIGARSCAPDGWVIGRLVPSGIGDGLMFDMPPLPVPALLARAVAESGRLDALLATVESGLLCSEDLLREDYELATDVGELEVVRFGTAPRDYARVMTQLRQGRDEVGRAAYRVLERARAGDVPPVDQAQVGAAALNPGAFDDVRRLVVRTGEPGFLPDWVDRVAEPARGRLRELVQL